jgi:polyisoprenoid-binding protein YceI
MVLSLGFTGISAQAQEKAQGAPAPVTYKVDPVHSSVVFRVQHNEVSYFFGNFNELTGTVVLNDKEPAKSSVDLNIKADSVETRNDKRNQHLKGPDFFDVIQFPAITFKSKEVKKLDGDNWEVAGDLTLHGVTKPLTVKFAKTGEKKDQKGTLRAGGIATFSIKRSDFGMKFMIPAVGDEVNLTVSIEATGQ